MLPVTCVPGSINYALHALSHEEASLQDEGIQEQLKLLNNTAQQAAAELRISIYRLNPSQRGDSIFIDYLASYLDDLGRLNSVKVGLQAEGNEEILSPALRKGLYRITREAILYIYLVLRRYLGFYVEFVFCIQYMPLAFMTLPFWSGPNSKAFFVAAGTGGKGECRVTAILNHTPVITLDNRNLLYPVLVQMLVVSETS